jgi:hypothetical protein
MAVVALVIHTMVAVKVAEVILAARQSVLTQNRLILPHTKVGQRQGQAGQADQLLDIEAPADAPVW